MRNEEKNARKKNKAGKPAETTIKMTVIKKKNNRIQRLTAVWMLILALTCTGMPMPEIYAAEPNDKSVIGAETETGSNNGSGTATGQVDNSDFGSGNNGSSTSAGQTDSGNTDSSSGSRDTDSSAGSTDTPKTDTGGINWNDDSDSTSGQTTGDEFVSDVNIYSSYNYLPIGTYDSADTAIIKSIDDKERTITLFNTKLAKSYTLNYDGTTYVSDKYGTPMSIDQLSEGTIVNVNFYKATRQLVDIQLSPEAWTYESVTRYDLGGINSTATIGDRTYALTKGVQVFAKGEQTDLLSIVDGDVLTVSGLGYDIYSIKVESGHGYVRLTADEALVGGWLEIGGALITKVTEPGMLLTVPEGEYTVSMYNDNSSSVKQILVESGQEILLDCSEITAPVDTFGKILFHVTPATATVKLDGNVVDISGIVKTEYGIHEIEVSAPGYDTLLRYINVGNELSEITVMLDESVAYTSGNSSPFANADTTKPVSANSSNNTKKTSGNSSSANSSKTKTVSTNKYNRVYVYAPENAEVYVDGLYAGLIPMSFKKVQGSHTVILKRDGYETRSYTIYVFDDGEDMSISFSELNKIDGNDPSDGDDSGKTDTDKDKNKDKSGTGDDAGKTDTEDDTGKSDTEDDTGDDTGKTDPDDDTGKTDTGDGTGKTDTGDDTGKTDTGDDTGKTDTGDGTGETGTGDDTGQSGTGDDTGKIDTGGDGTGNTDAGAGSDQTGGGGNSSGAGAGSGDSSLNEGSGGATGTPDRVSADDSASAFSDFLKRLLEW